MFLMEINIDPFDKRSIEKAIKQLEDYRDSLDNKLKRVAEELAKIGVPVVLVAYNNGIDEGNADYDVRVESTEKGCKLVAEGQDVCFLEFGAGTTTKSYEGEGQEGLPPIYPGSWSKESGGVLGGMFDRYGYWIWNGERYVNLEPKLGLYKASEEMQRRAVEITKKVFANDRY